jgi:uncharacterized phage protein (TIGR02218 family)
VAQVLETALDGMPETALRLDAQGQAERVSVQRLAPGDLVRLSAGCDLRAVTCREKFGNFRNFRGFPHVPSEDWITAMPSREVAAGS